MMGPNNLMLKMIGMANFYHANRVWGTLRGSWLLSSAESAPAAKLQNAEGA